MRGKLITNNKLLQDEGFQRHMEIVTSLIDKKISNEDAENSLDERKIVEESNRYASIIQQ